MTISTVVFIILFASFIMQIIYLLKRETKPDPLSHHFLLVASLLLFITIIIRSIKIRFIAITNLYESLIFFSGVISFVLFIYRIKLKERLFPFVQFGGTIIVIILLAIAYSPVASEKILHPIPALQSYWLVLHVSFSFIGEAFFAFSFIAAIYFLATKDGEKRNRLDRLIYTAIGIGYPIFTAGALIFGAIWAEYAWGRYWSWDPKETWALITWFVYTGYLHTRLIKKWKGNTSAILAILGFVFTIFTFFGVNYLLSGFHSYA